jgi:hypothetical protein
MAVSQCIVVDLLPLSTARENCLLLNTGPVDEEKVEQAETYRFDQLPVLDSEGSLCGLIATKAARQLFDSGTDLLPTTADLHMREVQPQMEMFGFLCALEQSRALVIRDQDRSAATPEDWFALVTVSDLNRHPFRNLLFHPLVNLEVALAELVDLYFDEPWDWIELTSEGSQIRIVGQWEVEKRSSMDTHPVTGCMLTDLVKVVEKSAVLREKLGYKSKSKYKNATERFPDFRNQVMHPVRPLVLKPDDVAILIANLENAMSLSSTVNKLNEELRAETARGVRFLP